MKINFLSEAAVLRKKKDITLSPVATALNLCEQWVKDLQQNPSLAASAFIARFIILICYVKFADSK